MNQLENEVIDEPTFSKLICTSNHGFAPYAQEELHRLFGSVKSKMLIPGEVMLVSLQHELKEIYAVMERQEPIFLRHMFAVSWEYEYDEMSGDAWSWISELNQFIASHSFLKESNIVVQVRKSAQSVWQDSPAELKTIIQDGLSDLAAQFVVKDADYVISIFAAQNGVYAGVEAVGHQLSDWNGGAIRFQKEEGQVSRAKFKLLEAEVSFGIPFSSFHNALDIGAAPGGWTSFLLERGLKVTAVDPAKMAPSVLASPNLTYLKKNADSVKFNEGQFDLLVCDMSWSPKGTAKLVINLLDALQPGGTAIVTVKLLHKKPMALISEIISMFQDARLQVQRAKQLAHNRDEITLYMIKY